jgi:hypothetical protein
MSSVTWELVSAELSTGFRTTGLLLTLQKAAQCSLQRRIQRPRPVQFLWEPKQPNLRVSVEQFPFYGYITCRCAFKRKQSKSALVDHQSISESPLHISTVMMFITNNKYEITNETHDEVNIRSINSEVASSQRYVRSLIESMLRRMRSVVEAHGFWTFF